MATADVAGVASLYLQQFGTERPAVASPVGNATTAWSRPGTG